MFGIISAIKKIARGTALLFLGVLVFVPVSTHLYYSPDLVSKEKIMNRNDGGVILMDRKGRPFFTFYDAKNKKFVPLQEVPKNIQNAVIAIEDKDFWTHKGVSPKALVRALFADVASGKLQYGGSTLTQQLAKNALLTQKKSFVRKYQEVVLAREIEEKYSKPDILEMYLNSVYMGRGCFGVQECAQAFFGNDVESLDLAQSAFLAALLPAPSKLSSNVSHEAAKARQELVLQKMLEQGYITSEQKKEAEGENLVFAKTDQAIISRAPHFAFLVKDELLKKYNEEELARSGLKVRTTLDLDWQDYAEKTVATRVAALAPRNVSNGAAVIMDPKTGEIRALVGSKDWSNDEFGKVDVATSLRQPGSSFKPIVYAKAMEEGLITPATVLNDEPIEIKLAGQPLYIPEDYDGKFRGPVTVRRALANSLNVPAVEVIQKLGVTRAIEAAQEMGITSIEDNGRFGPSLVLGSGEVQLVQLAGAYAVFANEGERVAPTTILEIADKFDKQVYAYNPQPERVLSPQVSFLVSSILSDNNARKEEFGDVLNISRSAAVKTGTTQSYRDSWTLGYTPSLVVGVWVGNNDGRHMDKIAGSIGAAPIWKDLMEHFLAGTSVENFEEPLGITKLTICDNGLPVAPGVTGFGHTEYFIEGTEPHGICLPPLPPEVATTDENKDQPQPENGQPAATDTPTPQPAVAVNVNTPDGEPGRGGSGQ